jgi:hypothetical protein
LVKIEKKIKLWKKLMWISLIILFLATVFMFIIHRIDNNRQLVFEQQELENRAWLLLEPSENETTKAIYDYLSPTSTTDFNQKLKNLEQITTIDNYIAIYKSHEEQVWLIIEGKLDPREMLIKFDTSKDWVKPWPNNSILIWFFCLINLAIAGGKYAIMAMERHNIMLDLKKKGLNGNGKG